MQTLDELLQNLKKEDQEFYVYRGQLREYPGPLVPSAYRPFVTQSRSDGNDELPATLRKVEQVKLIERHLVGSHGDRESMLENQRRQVRGLIRNFFGYAFTEVLCQQAGLCSESIDVTKDPEIAAFFASFQWGRDANGRQCYTPYTPKSKKEYGIIYRWKIVPQKCSINMLKDWSYTYCPSVLDSCEILNLFDKCSDIDESIRSLERYKEAFRDETGFMSYYAGQRRPLEILRIPNTLQSLFRIYKQSAMLLVPDVLENKQFWDYQYPDFPKPNYGFWDGVPMIEDFAKSRNVDIYRFVHVKEQIECLSVSGEEISGNQDVELILTTGWLKSYFSNPYGTIRISLSEEFKLSSIDIFSEKEDFCMLEKKLQDGDFIVTQGKLAIKEKVDSLLKTLTHKKISSTNNDVFLDIYKTINESIEKKEFELTERLLVVIRKKLSDFISHEQLLWCTDKLSYVLQKQRRFQDAKIILDEMLSVCKSKYFSEQSEESIRHLIAANSSLFNYYKYQGFHDQLKTSYIDCVNLFNNNLSEITKLFIAHVRHWLAEELDQDYKFSESLEQYSKLNHVVRNLSFSNEETSSLIVTSSFSRANCLEKLGDTEAAKKEFLCIVKEFSSSKYDRCKYAAGLALERAKQL